MESNGELFGWNSLKINQEAEVKVVRKRKLSEERSPKQVDKDPLSLDVKKISKKENIRKGKCGLRNVTCVSSRQSTIPYVVNTLNIFVSKNNCYISFCIII